MAYNINKYNTPAAPAIVVEDGTINTTLDLKLIGKNYAGYGETQNENFVWLLENFASRTEPPNAIVGQLWFDTSVQKLKVNYSLNKWHTLGVMDVIDANQSPEGLQIGDCWWNLASEQMYCKSTSGDILIGGKAPAVVTQMRSSTVTDTSNVTHEIIEAVVQNHTIFIINYDTEFTLKPTVSDINGFTLVKKGITMRDAPIDYVPPNEPAFKLWGTVENAEQLGGYAPSEYVNQTSPQFANVVNFSGNGLTIGASPNQTLHIYNDLSGLPTIYNEHTNTIQFKTTVTVNGTATPKNPLKLVGEDVLPGNAGHSNLGLDTARFATVYATTFDGTATLASSATISNSIVATMLDGTTTATANAKVGSLATLGALGGTVAVRTATDFQDGSQTVTAGALLATYFVGTALFSQGGDIAEKYLADEKYDTGTVLMVGGDREVTAAQFGFRAIGVVSAHPGYIMNHRLEDGTTVALKGRVPVKVAGNVKKGDRLIASNDGVAKVLESESDSLVFAIALSGNKDGDVIEALIL